MEEITEIVFGALVGAAIGSLIGAMVLRIAAKWSIKEHVDFGNAWATVFIAYLLNMAIGFAVGFVVGVATQSEQAVDAASVLFLPVGFLVTSGVISSRLRISFGKACWVSAVMVAIWLGLLIVFAGGLFLIMQAAA